MNNIHHPEGEIPDPSQSIAAPAPAAPAPAPPFQRPLCPAPRKYGTVRNGTKVKDIGQGGYGTVALYTAQSKSSNVFWARKSVPRCPKTEPEKTQAWAEYELLKKARDENAQFIITALELLPGWRLRDTPMLITLVTRLNLTWSGRKMVTSGIISKNFQR